MNFFRKLFSRKSAAQNDEIMPETPPATTYAATMMSREELDQLLEEETEQTTDPLPEETAQQDQNRAQWIEAADNPFGVRILDCRSSAISMATASEHPEVAERFLALRSSDGSEYVGKFPENGVRAEVSMEFVTKEGAQVPDGPVFRAGSMEEKWDIYKHFGFLYFVRSWSGALVYCCNYIPSENGFRVDMVILNEAEIRQEDPLYHLKVVEFLLCSHVLNTPAPHPVPLGLPEEEVPLYSFSQFGNRGYFATYE